MEGKDIPHLPVKFKNPASEENVSLIRVFGKCLHSTLLVDEALDTVECQDCHEKLDPMWALKKVCLADSQFHRMRERYQDEVKRLGERTRTKCRCCGKMTLVSHR